MTSNKTKKLTFEIKGKDKRKRTVQIKKKEIVPNSSDLEKTVDIPPDSPEISSQAIEKTVDIHNLTSMEKTVDINTSNVFSNTDDTVVESHATMLDASHTSSQAQNTSSSSGGSLKSGNKILHYQIISKIGSGAMGEVFKASDLQLHRDVAIKTLHPSLAAKTDLLQRFQREAQSLAQIRHPNIVQIYGLHNFHGTHFFAMEFIESATDLQEYIASKKIEIEKALAILLGIAQGLQAIHERGIVHRDIKPANIMMDLDVPRIADFGIVRWQENSPLNIQKVNNSANPELTHSGAIMGTPFYLAPECISGGTASPVSDIYAFGVIAFEMLSGAKPFQGQTLTEVFQKHLNERVPDLKQHNVDPKISQIIRKMLAKSPQERYQSAEEVYLELLKWQEQQMRKGEIETRREMSKNFAQVVSSSTKGSWLKQKPILLIAIFVSIMWIFSLVIEKELQPKEKLSTASYPGNIFLDQNWEKDHWGRSVGKVLEVFTDIVEVNGKQGNIVVIENFSEEQYIFVSSPTYLDKISEYQEESIFIGWQGKVAEFSWEEEKNLALIALPEYEIPIRSTNLFLLEETLETVEEYDDSMLDATGNVVGTVSSYYSDSENIVLSLTDGTHLVFNQQATSLPIRIGDEIEMRGTITYFELIGEKEIYAYGLQFNHKNSNHWVQRKSLAKKIELPASQNK